MRVSEKAMTTSVFVAIAVRVKNTFGQSLARASLRTICTINGSMPFRFMLGHGPKNETLEPLHSCG
jgi:hypothetical protein